MVQWESASFFVGWMCCSIPSSDLFAAMFLTWIGVVLQQRGRQGQEFFKCGYLSEGWCKHGRVQLPKRLQWSCLSLPVAWRGSCHPTLELPCLWIRQEKNNNHYPIQKDIRLMSYPSLVWASQTQARVVAELNLIQDLITGMVVELQRPSTK